VDNVLVYHASYCKVEEPRVIKGKFTKDFGEGFYCTIIREQAERWAKKYETPVINKYNCLLHSKLNIKEFKEMDGEWLDFTTHGLALRLMIITVACTMKMKVIYMNPI